MSPSPRSAKELLSGAAIGGAVGFFVFELGLLHLVSYWGDGAPIVALGLAGGFALAWLRRGQLMLLAALVAVELLYATIALTPLTSALRSGLVRRDPIEPADAVYVLGSSMQRDGDFTSSSLTRLVHGLELLAAGRAPLLIVSELPEPHDRHAAAAAAQMRRLNMPHELVSIGRARNTREEALALAKLAGERGWKKLLVVTSPIHSRRASLALEQVGLQVISSPAMETRYDLETLDTPETRLEAFGPLMHEIVGTVVYRWRGWVPERR